MSEEHTIHVSPDGAVAFVYDDALAALLDAGAATIRRASHVEPTADARWTADMSPSGGDVLGPFGLRGQAIEAERAWLEERQCGVSREGAR